MYTLNNSYKSELQAIIGQENMRKMRGEKTTWTMFFKDESEILNVFRQIPLEYIEYICTLPSIKGTTYITSFKKQFDATGSLSPKQITQCKRIAFELYKLMVVSKYLVRC